MESQKKWQFKVEKGRILNILHEGVKLSSLQHKNKHHVIDIFQYICAVFAFESGILLFRIY